MFVNLGFLKSKFSYLTIGEYRKGGCLKPLILNTQVFIFDYGRISKRRMFENLGFAAMQVFFCLTVGENRKVWFIKVGDKKSAISETSAFSTWPKSFPGLVGARLLDSTE